MPVDNPTAIADYIRTLGLLPAAAEGVDGVLTSHVSEVDGVNLILSEQRKAINREIRDFSNPYPAPDTLWAGATITGNSVESGALSPIFLSRHPGTITITTDLNSQNGKSQSMEIPIPSIASYIDTLNTLINVLKPLDSAALAEYQMIQIDTIGEAAVEFGLDVSIARAFDGNLDAKLNNNLSHSITFGKFYQTYYQVVFSPQGSPPQFFSDNVTLDQVKQYCGPDNPPCYIASINYGRACMFLVDSEASGGEVRASLTAHYEDATKDIKVQPGGSHQEVMKRSQVRAFAIGSAGNNAANLLVDPKNELIPWLKENATFNTSQMVYPISYTLRYLAPPHHMVRVIRTTRPVKLIDATVYGGPVLVGNFAVGEGRGKGPVPTEFRLNRGDRVTITARGTIWAGWVFIGRNGPDGLAGPPPGNVPLPQNGNPRIKGSMLIAGYDNTDWIPIGSGANFTVPDDKHGRELWLSINDDNLTTGNGNFDVKVTVERRMPVINAFDRY